MSTLRLTHKHTTDYVRGRYCVCHLVTALFRNILLNWCDWIEEIKDLLDITIQIDIVQWLWCLVFLCCRRKSDYVVNCVCLLKSVHRITTKATNQIFVKFYGTVGHNPGTSRLVFSEIDPRSRSLEVKRSKSFSRITQFKTSCRRAAAAICPRPKCRQAAARSGRWRGLCCRPYKLSIVTWTGNQRGLMTLTQYWPFDLESDVRVTCDVGNLCANFGLPRPLCSRLRPDVCDRQTDRRQTASSLNAPPIRGGA